MSQEPLLVALGLVLIRELISWGRDRHSKLLNSVERNSVEISELRFELKNLSESMESFHAFYSKIDELDHDVALLKALRQQKRPN